MNTIEKQLEGDQQSLNEKQGIEKYLGLVKDFFGKLNLEKLNLGKLKKGGEMKKIKRPNVQISVNKTGYLVSRGLLIIALAVFVFLGLKVFSVSRELGNKTFELRNISSYNLNDFRNSEFVVSAPGNLSEMLELREQASTEKNKLESESNFRKSVYSYFLKNLLLPSLNIWKDPYTQKIDILLMGERYLDNDPYQDISLLSQWGSIIRDSGKGVGINEIVDMRIGNIVEMDSGYFHIPITVSFKSDSKRAFLLLVDKISTTSNPINIGLINEFSYYLFNAIRDQKKSEIQELIETSLAEDLQKIMPSESLDTTNREQLLENITIGYYLYNFIKNNEETNLLIDDLVIDQAIRESVVCGTDRSNNYCYFMFRNKYRSLPELAYSVGLESTINKPYALKDFYASLPPLISIRSFTFDKAKTQGLTFVDDTEYVGNLSFNVYGRGISANELSDITKLLEDACFGENPQFKMDEVGVIARVDKAIADIGAADNKKDIIEKTTDYLQLKDIFTEDRNAFQGLSQYNKIVKRFEHYRMLKDNNLCM